MKGQTTSGISKSDRVNVQLTEPQETARDCRTGRRWWGFGNSAILIFGRIAKNFGRSTQLLTASYRGRERVFVEHFWQSFPARETFIDAHLRVYLNEFIIFFNSRGSAFVPAGSWIQTEFHSGHFGQICRTRNFASAMPVLLVLSQESEYAHPGW